ncbi:MAG: GNAT family N-acetyltransferase [Betaproteobacteria bacterium]
MAELIVVRHTTHADIPHIVDIQSRVYAGVGVWDREHLEQQLDAFPQGQVVACLGSRVVGAASSLIIRWDDWGVWHSWDEVTGKGTFSTHSPGGRTLYGAEVFADPAMRRLGIGAKLYGARRRICRAFNLRRVMACGRMPNYHTYASRYSPEEYAMRVIWGDVEDPVLLFQLREGFHYCGINRGYLPWDDDSLGNATVIVWLNKHFKPGRPDAVIEGGVL